MDSEFAKIFVTIGKKNVKNLNGGSANCKIEIPLEKI
jgi:hypothetical protein